ncbi:MAG: chromate resistance protein [Deltaproteobacteria bacterium]|nr:chromate resistance protein [Deltaproteobacteria bacterium]
MTIDKNEKWLLLIHQLPPQPNALRVKIWRRLHQVGAVAIKQSVYALPFSDQSREDLSWILKEILEGGGDGSISEARFLEGLTDEQVKALFQNAREEDYEKIIREARLLLTEFSSPEGKGPKDEVLNGTARHSRLQRRWAEIAAIDFFPSPEREIAAGLINGLEKRISGSASPITIKKMAVDHLKGSLWVTRRNLYIDRIACGWLIRRFIDPEATFKFITGTRCKPKPGERCFDLFDGDFTHEGDRCTFEVMTRRLGFQSPALTALAEIVHDIDLKDGRYSRQETEGFRALLTGLVSSVLDDARRLEEGARLFDNLYAYFQKQRSKPQLPAVNPNKHTE